MALPVAPGKVAMRKTFGIMASYRMRFVWVLVLQITAVLATLVAPQLLGRLVTRVSAGTGTVDYVDKIVLVIVVVTIVGAIINRYAQMYARTLGESVFADLRERMMTRVVHLPLSAVESAGTGDLVGRTTNDVSRIEFLVRVGVPQIMVCTVTIVFTIAAAAISDPLLALGLLVVGPPVWAMMSWYLPISVPAYRAGSASYARLNGVVSETVDHAQTVDALGIGRRREQVIGAAVSEAWSLEKYTAWLRVRLYLVLDVAWRAPVVVILLWGGFLAAHGWASLGAITTVTLYAMELRKPIGQLMFWIDQVQISQASLQRILGVEEVPDDRTPTGVAPQNTRIQLRDVHFAYREGVEVLHGIDLDLVPGERLAVVGPSGSGKSTLGRMLAGINPPTSGAVTVGGVPLTDLTEVELRRHVALVTQEQHVFVGTLADNVRLGRPDADDATIAAAIAAIGAHTWVNALPDGMNTMVGSGHLNLTPAQAQEVALARLVLLDPHTLILDEATSLLDPHAARTLERTLSTALAGRTVIEVAHRLYTAQDADRVAVMMDGRIVELGTHDELVALGGEYASLWEAWTQE
ncbi:ABC transporter ATP-binding protein [Actinomyces sp. MRS3W]|uniref:ABC transporter ATP-binding protein n=1 Tax=Actinomyces sp. MRS3W TaxID=2800796 RepID=UPI0028FD41E2|nr:ABC transporter ATP-binding protein [Actinomyces sp. MRS3W]MDU0349107.1 ABC transporter ATP-binding protein [Actinomyces sp. MRS3W]